MKLSGYVRFNHPKARWHFVKDLDATLKRLNPTIVYVDDIFYCGGK